MSNILFLVGGPGSGKDIIIKNLNEHFVLKEYNIEQIKDTDVLADDCIVSANAYKLADILALKESINKDNNIALIYVDVDDAVSKARLLNRNINESVRMDRLIDSKLNLQKFKEDFSDVYYFNNSFNIDSNNTKEQLSELADELAKRTSLENKRKEGLVAAKRNRILYKKKVEKDAKEVSKMNPPQLDKQTKDFVDYHLGNKLTHDLKKVKEDSEYSNFKTDKEVKKQKKIPAEKFLKGIIPRKSLGPTFDTRDTGDTALIQTYTTKTFEDYRNLDDFLDEAVDSPNAADTGLFGAVNSPNVNQTNDKPLFGYQVAKEKNKNRKKNFETDKEMKKESTYKKVKKIFFRG